MIFWDKLYHTFQNSIQWCNVNEIHFYRKVYQHNSGNIKCIFIILTLDSIINNEKVQVQGFAKQLLV